MDFLKDKIKQNAQPAADITDNNRTFSHLVSSAAIAYVLYAHGVYLNFDIEDYRSVFLSFFLRGNPKEKNCSAFDKLLSQFDDGVWV